MLFLISHRHTAEKCPGNEGKEAVDKHYRSLQVDVARRLGIKLVASYTAPIEHARFIVLQTDSFEALRDYLEPLYLIGSVEIFPVSSFSERVHNLGERLEAPPTDYYCMTCRVNFFENEMEAHSGHKYYNQKQMEEIWPHELGGEAGGG
ncbi:MAG: DUF3303 domain-containing protein [Nitrososphaerales archaeon]